MGYDSQIGNGHLTCFFMWGGGVGGGANHETHRYLRCFFIYFFNTVQTHFTDQNFFKLDVSTGYPLGPVISQLLFNTVHHWTVKVRTPDAPIPMTKSLWMVPTQGSNFKQPFSLWRKGWTLVQWIHACNINSTVNSPRPNNQTNHLLAPRKLATEHRCHPESIFNN